MNDPPRPVLKKPKIEKTSEAGEEKRSNNGGNHEQEDEEETTRKEQEEALVALIEHRTKEVEHLRHRISYYTTQVCKFFSLFLPFFGSVFLRYWNFLNFFVLSMSFDFFCWCCITQKEGKWQWSEANEPDEQILAICNIYSLHT